MTRATITPFCPTCGAVGQLAGERVGPAFLNITCACGARYEHNAALYQAMKASPHWEARAGAAAARMERAQAKRARRAARRTA